MHLLCIIINTYPYVVICLNSDSDIIGIMEKDCEDWIRKHLPEYYDLFNEQDFTTLEAIAIVDDNDLEIMGVTSVGKRKTILSKILLLKAAGTRNTCSASLNIQGNTTVQLCEYFQKIILLNKKLKV